MSSSASALGWTVIAGLAVMAISCGRTLDVGPKEQRTTSGAAAPRLARDVNQDPHAADFEPTSDVPIGVIRWDGAPVDPKIRTQFGIGPALLTRYAYMEPSLGWYLYGDGVDTQSIVDAEILEDSGAIGYYAFVWYPPHELLDAADDTTPVSDIQLAFEAYLRSPYKEKIKFALILQSYWLRTPRAGTDWGYLDTFAAWVKDQTQDPQYQTIDGAPLIYLFDSLNMPTEEWQRFTATVGPTFAVDVNHQFQQANRLGLQGLATYGPAGAELSGSGQRPWSEQRDIDQSHWGTPMSFADVRSLTPLCDSRPRHGTEETYGDQPTQPEWYDHIRNALSGDPKLVLIYARNEYDEGGGTTGTSFRDGTRFNDALRWARGADRPASYTYEIDAHSMVCAGVGTWTYDFPNGGIAGAFAEDEVLSNTAGDTKILTHAGMLAVTLFATTGPDRGIAQVDIDGARAVTVDLFAASQTRHVGVFRSRALDGESHTVEVTVTGKKRPESSSAQVGLDSFVVTYAP